MQSQRHSNIKLIGLSRVHAPRSQWCGLNTRHYFSFSLSSLYPSYLLFSQKELSYGFEILHGLLSYQMIRIPTKKIIRGPLLPPALCYMWADKGGYFQKVVVGFRNFGYDFWGVGRDVWRWLCRHMRRKISARVDGGTSGPVKRVQMGSEDPRQR